MLKQQRDALKAFRDANPEKYAELMAKVQTQIVEEDAHPYLALSSNSQAKSTSISDTLKERLAEFAIAANGRKDYFIHVEIPHDGWTETHTYFEMLYKPDPLDAIIKLAERWQLTLSPENVKDITKCNCPLCIEEVKELEHVMV